MWRLFVVFFLQRQVCDGQAVSTQTDGQTLRGEIPAETPAKRGPKARNPTRGGRARGMHVQQPHRQPLQGVRDKHRNDIVTRTVSIYALVDGQFRTYTVC